jgi:hypothetical protein
MYQCHSEAELLSRRLYALRYILLRSLQTYCGEQPCGPILCVPSDIAVIEAPCTAPNETPLTQYAYIQQQASNARASIHSFVSVYP